MKTSDFYYDLPQELIAQTPLERRDSSRLMVLHRETGELEHRHFYDIVDYLQPGDCLVMNDSRVLPARLLGHRVPTGGAVELLLLQDKGGGIWECLAKPGRKLHPGAELSFGDGALTATVTAEEADGRTALHKGAAAAHCRQGCFACLYHAACGTRNIPPCQGRRDHGAPYAQRVLHALR